MTTNSIVQIDVEQIVAALQQQVQGNNSLWQDLLSDSTGQALIEFIATAGGYGIYANERALQEAFPDSARLISSIYASMRLLGVRLSRKLPASCTVLVTKPADGQAYVIPAYSQFSSPQGPLFNRTAISFSTTQLSQTATLYQGTIKTVNMLGTGNPLQTFISSDTNFTVSDQDVTVLVGGTSIPVVTDGLWNYGAVAVVVGGIQTTQIKPAVQDKTTNTGQLELNFGNSNYGTVPEAGQSVQITYAITAGYAGNNPSFSGVSVAYDNYSTIVSTTSLSGGGDQTAPQSYQRIGPAAFSSFNRAVNKSEYSAIAATYPGVIDAKLIGQSGIAPTLVTYMNAVRVSLLTSTAWSSTDYANFLTWLQQRTMGYMNFYFANPEPVNYSIIASVFCNSTADLDTVKSNCLSGLTSVTTPSYGWIGRSVYLTEISEAIYKADQNVLYVKIASPVADFVTAFNPTTMVAVQTGTGSAPPSTTITYTLTGVNTNSGTPQESLGVPLVITTNLQGGNGIQLSWDLMTGLSAINVYATRGGVTGLLASLPGNATSYFDNYTTPLGSQTPPTVDNFGVWYPNCVNIQLNMFAATDRGTGAGG